MLGEKDGGVRNAAHRLARLHGTKAASLADSLWKRVRDPQDKRHPADRLMDLTTLMAVDAEPKGDNWARLLAEGDPLLVADAVRSWRLTTPRSARPRWPPPGPRRATPSAAGSSSGPGA